MALLALGTFCHGLTNDDALAWLAAAWNLLRPGGLLILELAHPGDIFDMTLKEVCMRTFCPISQCGMFFSSTVSLLRSYALFHFCK